MAYFSFTPPLSPPLIPTLHTPTPSTLFQYPQPRTQAEFSCHYTSGGEVKKRMFRYVICVGPLMTFAGNLNLNRTLITQMIILNVF